MGYGYHALLTIPISEFSVLLRVALHPLTLFLKNLCSFSKNKETVDKVSNGSDKKCSKDLKNHSYISVEIMVV